MADGSGTGSGSEPTSFESLRDITRRRIYDLITSIHYGDSKSSGKKVLILDDLTYKIVSHVLNLAENKMGLSVELIDGSRQTHKTKDAVDAIYFVQPSKTNIAFVKNDLAQRWYREAYLFLSSRPDNDLLNSLDKWDYPLNKFSEVDLEYVPIDRHTFVTDNPTSLGLFGNDRDSESGSACVSLMANRLLTVFLSLKESPVVRYQTGTSVSFKLASKLDSLVKEFGGSLSQNCELLILDRSVDQIAPLITEWTYEGMCHELLELKDNIYMFEAKDRKMRPFLLDDSDPLWQKYRYSHINDVFEKFAEMIEDVRSSSLPEEIDSVSAGVQISVAEKGDMTKSLIEKSKLEVHVQIAVKIHKILDKTGLVRLGELEQKVLSGKADEAYLTSFLDFSFLNKNLSVENKLRLLMIYAAVHPEKYIPLLQLMEVTKLSQSDRTAVTNMKFLMRSSPSKVESSRHNLMDTFVQILRRARVLPDDEKKNTEQYTVPLNCPMIEGIVEQLITGNLCTEQFPYLTQNATYKNSQSKIYIFIVGGMTRSEVRVCHHLSTTTKRQIIIGSSSLDDPREFVEKMKRLTF